MGLTQDLAVLHLTARPGGAFQRDGDAEKGRRLRLLDGYATTDDAGHRFRFRRRVQQQRKSGEGDGDHGETLRPVNFWGRPLFRRLRLEMRRLSGIYSQ